jgi:hypothetical protein
VAPLIWTVCGDAQGGVPVKSPFRSGSDAAHLGSVAPESGVPEAEGEGDGVPSQLGGLSQSENEHPLHEPLDAVTGEDDLQPDAAPSSAHVDAVRVP